MNLENISQPMASTTLLDVNTPQNVPHENSIEDSAPTSALAKPKQPPDSASCTMNTSLAISKSHKTIEAEAFTDKPSNTSFVKREQPRSLSFVSKRPELYSGLGPWDFLIDRSNVLDNTEGGVSCNNKEYLRRISQQRLETTIKGLEEIIVKFKKVIEETCGFDDASNTNTLSGTMFISNYFRYLAFLFTCFCNLQSNLSIL